MATSLAKLVMAKIWNPRIEIPNYAPVYYGFSSENEHNSEMKIFPVENLDANIANLCKLS